MTGWGKTGDDEEASRTLKVVQLDIIDLALCQEKFAVELVGFKEGYKIHDTQICTFNENKDACQVCSTNRASYSQEQKYNLTMILVKNGISG